VPFLPDDFVAPDGVAVASATGVGVTAAVVDALSGTVAAELGVAAIDAAADVIGDVVAVGSAFTIGVFGEVVSTGARAVAFDRLCKTTVVAVAVTPMRRTASAPMMRIVFLRFGTGASSVPVHSSAVAELPDAELPDAFARTRIEGSRPESDAPVTSRGGKLSPMSGPELLSTRAMRSAEVRAFIDPNAASSCAKGTMLA
jgi:hypothetical protein